MVFQNDLHTCQRCISTTFAKAVDSYVKSLTTAQHGSQGIRDSHVVIVVSVKVETKIGIALAHLSQIFNTLQGVHDAERIGKHEAHDVRIEKRVHQPIDIVGRIFHAVAPILKIKIHFYVLSLGIFYCAQDI